VAAVVTENSNKKAAYFGSLSNIATNRIDDDGQGAKVGATWSLLLAVLVAIMLYSKTICPKIIKWSCTQYKM
jgi:hypothetical protein